MPSVAKSVRSNLAQWLGFIRFSHTIFALPFAGLATVMSYASPMPSGDRVGFSIWVIFGVLGCMVFARSAAMAFNRVVDREIDQKNPRTASRHLPSGLISVHSAKAFTVICSVGFILCTLFFWPNWIPVLFSVPVLCFLCGYSLAKRFTAAAHVWLGLALSLSPLCVWFAVRGPDSALVLSEWYAPMTLALGIAAWVTGFDIIYACQDAEYDAAEGLHSVPAKFGVSGALRLSMVSHGVMLLLLLLLPVVAPVLDLGWIYFVGVGLVSVLVIRQHLLVSASDLGRVNEAFFNVNAWISMILLLFGSADTLLR